jgi:hypothetical protein
VTLINTEGMAFIGPGSEWFWTAVSGLILAITFIAIYRQLRAHSSTRAFELLQAYVRESESEPVQRAAIEILTAVRDGTDPSAIPAGPAGVIGGIWERYALLARHGHIDVKLLWEFDSEGPQGWWLLLAQRTRKRRENRGPKLLEHLEWLAGVMAEMDRRAGEHVLGPDDVFDHLDTWIGVHTEELRVARERRTVLVDASSDQLRNGSTPTLASMAVSEG